jgi:hypothetical protein
MVLPVNLCQSPISTASARPNPVKVLTPRRQPNRRGVNSLSAAISPISASSRSPADLHCQHGLVVGIERQPGRLARQAHLVERWRAGKHTSAELAELFSVARSTVYRAIQRAGHPDTARPSGTNLITKSPYESLLYCGW